MKRFTLSLLLAVVFCITCAAQQSIGLIVDTNGDGYTNIRNSPKGKVVARLQDGDMISVDICTNGWFHISEREYGDSNGEYCKLPLGTDYWIHSSQLTASWVSDGLVTVTLRATPNAKGAVVFSGKGTNASIQIKDILDHKGSWLKVRLKNGKTGWVSDSIICGNSLTVCN